MHEADQAGIHTDMQHNKPYVNYMSMVHIDDVVVCA
jgi:hypothetical protein